MSPQKNVFLLLVLSAFATLATAGETITFDGSNPALLKDDPWGNPNSLFPATSPTGNAVNVTGGTVGGYVFGGITDNAIGVSNNRVTLSGGEVGGDVYGGHSDSGNATGNSVTVTVTGGEVTGHVFGGSSDIGNATGNSVTVTGGSVGGFVYGGYSYSGNVTGNSVTVSGGSVGGSVSGGYSYSGNATGNSVTVSDGRVDGAVYGGRSIFGNATGNSVTVRGGRVDGEVFGGQSGNNATGNSITLSGGEVRGNVYGGISASGNATHNTVTLGSAARLANDGSSRLSGGFSGGGDVFTGNTLNLIGWQGKVARVQNFEHYNFVLPASAANGDTRLTVTNWANLTGSGSRSSRVNVGFLGGGRVQQAGESFTLIASVGTGLLGTNASLNTTAQGLKGVSLLYDFALAEVDETLTATITSAPRLNPQTKALSEAQVAGVSFVNTGADFAADAGMASLLSGAATSTNNASTGSAARSGSAGSARAASNFGFGAVGGSSVRTETGSHVKVNGLSLIVGAGVSQSISLGELTLGGFFETGKGNLSTSNSFATGEVNGSGDTRYTGIGALAHLAATSGLYTEASARIGQVKNEFESDLRSMSGESARYDTKATYAGLHLGVGNVFALNGTGAATKNGALQNTLDVYGKYFFTHQGGDEATVAGDKFSFDAVTSHRLRTGARYNYALTEAATLYTGGAYEYEFDGKANASVYGMALDAPELKGGSGILELGATVRPSKTMPLTLNFGLQGYVGQREGISGQASLKYAF